MGKVARTRQGRRVQRGHGVRAAQRLQARPMPKPRMRSYWLKPDPSFGRVNVQVMLFRTRLAMTMGKAVFEGRKIAFDDHNVLGFCCDYYRKVGRKQPKLWGRQTVARVYLNAKDIHREPMDLFVHELGHAAHAYARYRGADVTTIVGEEVVCYALGRMVAQLNAILHACGAYMGELR